MRLKYTTLGLLQLNAIWDGDVDNADLHSPIRYRICWKTQSRGKRTVDNPIRTAKMCAYIALNADKELLKSDTRDDIPVE